MALADFEKRVGKEALVKVLFSLCHKLHQLLVIAAGTHVGVTSGVPPSQPYLKRERDDWTVATHYPPTLATGYLIY